MEEYQPHHELVKCVLVGDNAVGKTRLICARACRQKVSLSQLLTTHVPTVWAIDQYRIYKDVSQLFPFFSAVFGRLFLDLLTGLLSSIIQVLDNSMMTLDGVNVSLRLWDTFGDHHKDRRFAYGRQVMYELAHKYLFFRSDVVLMCFDVGRLSSLENCKQMWLPQVRKFCPNTPILLVGCKNDVRYILHDDLYLTYCRQRSPLVRQVRERDLVMPEVGRAVAKELGLPYYETSVLSYFGVDEVFENAIRAALCVRRQQRFWVTNLRRVALPSLQVISTRNPDVGFLIQAPFCPPKPVMPTLTDLPSSYESDRQKLFHDQHFTDVILVCGSVGFSAHRCMKTPIRILTIVCRFILAACSPLLLRILTSEKNADVSSTPVRSSSEASLVSSTFGPAVDFPEDTDLLLPPSTSPSDGPRYHGRRRRSTSFHLSPTMMGHWTGRKEENEELKPPQPTFRAINHPAIQSLRVEQCESLDDRGKVVTSVQTVLTCTKLIPPRAMRQLMKFVYTGSVDVSLCDLSELKEAAEFLNVPQLYAFVSSLMTPKKEVSLEDKRWNQTPQVFQRSLELICLCQKMFPDVLIKLDDGSLPAHKPILMARYVITL